MTATQVIVLATPVFFLLIALEYLVSVSRRKPVYQLGDAINSVSLGVLSQLSVVFTPLLALGLYTAAYNRLALWPNEAFWSSWYGVLLALLMYDFCYYWLHRGGHEVAVLWAAHVVHHQSQHYNLSTALRQTSSGALLAWLFYLPMALAGVPPLIFGIVALIDLLYQFWVHTELVGKLGWFDRVFVSPSNHRVHHAVNDPYLDKNYGGILILWDRLFGSFHEEKEPCVYGTRSALRSWDPLWANTEVYWGLLLDSWRARNWGDKLRVWFKPPGWRAPDVAQAWPKPAFDLAQVRRYGPALSAGTRWFACVQFVLLIVGVATVLWFAGSWPQSSTAIFSAMLLACYWALGGVLQGRLSMLASLLIESAALATASSALGMTEWHYLFKPLTMLLALVLVVQQFRARTLATRPAWLLGAALCASLAGDVFLMLPGNWFIPGLASFLVAHLFYIGLFRMGQAWFPSRLGLAAPLGVGALMLIWVWSGLPDPALKVAVSAYVLVIGLMAAQAIGRATQLRGSAAVMVAVGACVFVLSDSLIAVNRFVSPVPLAPLWILASYYAAQVLIVLQAGDGRGGAAGFR